MELDQLGPLQRQVLETLWKLEEATVHELLNAVPLDRKPAYTTILTTLQKLEKWGWVRHEAQGRAYVYRPARSRSEATGKSIRAFLSTLFQGKSDRLLEHLVNDGGLDDVELLKLQKLIEEKRRNRP